MEMCRCLSRFYWNSKWPPGNNFNFFVGTKTQKISLVNFFLNVNMIHHILSNIGMCKWFFKDTIGYNTMQPWIPKFYTIFFTIFLEKSCYKYLNIQLSMKLSANVTC